MSLPWPNSYAIIKDSLYSAWKVRGEIKIAREFTDGKSTAWVFVVDINSRNYNGLAILKLDTLHDWGPNFQQEIDRYAQAIKSSPIYAKEHLPALLDSHQDSGETALLCSIAGESLNSTQSILRFNTSQQLVAVQKIFYDILDNWNTTYDISPSFISPCDAFARWLDYRLDPAEGRIFDFLQDQCQLDPSSHSFSLSGQWFPNPFEYARNQKLWPSEHATLMANGKAHGDIHELNILVKIKNPFTYNYYLIDLAHYEDNSLLFFDHAYFELSSLLRSRGNAQFERWINLLKSITTKDCIFVDTGASEKEDFGILNLLHMVRKQVRRWITKKEHGRQEHLEGQAVLARIAAGLNFVNKDIDNHLKELSFLYAAANLKQYLTIFEIPCHQEGPPIGLGQNIQAPTSEDWREVWNACDHFDRHRNSYVLISGPEVTKSTFQGLEIVGQVPWSLVIDFNPDSRNGGLFSEVSQLSQRVRGVQMILPDNIREVNFKESIGWFMASGLREREETIPGNYRSWKQMYLMAIQELALNFKESLFAKPIVVVIFSHGLEENYLKWTCHHLDMVLGDEARYISVGSDTVNLGIDGANTQFISCNMQNFLSGLWQMYGTVADLGRIRLPKRGKKEIEQEDHYLEERDYQYIKEDLEIVHWGLVQEAETTTPLCYDFWRGHEITWTTSVVYHN